jgi:hypothetical protein
MAQLRDAKTGECIAEGTPEEMVLLADEVGVEEVMFDGVGEGFAPGAVKTRHQENIQAANDYATSVANDPAIPQERRDHARHQADARAAVRGTARTRRAEARAALRAARKLAKLPEP